MAGSTEQSEAAAAAVTTQTPKDTKNGVPTSPARSDKSSDSDGKPVRDKLKETRIDAQATSDPAASSDRPMNDVPNGSANADEHSPSNSDTDRGRVRRKRSREDFEDEVEGEKHPEKKEKGERHHVRKRSRDVKDIESGAPLKPPTTAVETIQENDADEMMTSPKKDISTAADAPTTTEKDSSPKNKRTRDQAEEAGAPAEQATKDSVTNGKPVVSEDEERDSKRPRDKDEAQSTANAETTTKIPPTSGFANTSAVSPFASMSAKPKASNDAAPPAQTSEDKFKASGFGSLAKAPSGFGGLASSEPKTGFGAVGGNTLSSFAGSKTATAAPASGFGALGGSSTSSFGGSTFYSSLGSGFGALGGGKPALSSFGAATPSDLTIKGLKSKATAFGTPGEDKDDESSDEEGGDDDDEKDTTEKERQSSQPHLSQQPHETGEEGETSAWAGRAKLYTMSGEGSSRAWKERGVGTFKLNVTVDEPKKARFVLRADGTHRLLLNAAVTKQLVFGGDSKGEKPKDGRLLFNSPTASGDLEMHLLKLKPERAVELWEEVSKVQETEL